MKAYGYIRVSTEEQHISPEAQREQIKAYYESRLKPRLQLACIAEDIGVSGGLAFLARPGGKGLQKVLQRGDAVVITKLDRGFRDALDAHATARIWKDAGIEVHFLDIGLDTNSAMGEMLLGILASVAQFERRRISDRTKEAFAWKKANGFHVKPPWGFKLTRRGGEKYKTRLIPNRQLLDFAELVARLYEEKGYSFMDIWRHCRQFGIRPRPNSDLDYRTVNRTYAHYCKFREEQGTVTTVDSTVTTVSPVESVDGILSTQRTSTAQQTPISQGNPAI